MPMEIRVPWRGTSADDVVSISAGPTDKQEQTLFCLFETQSLQSNSLISIYHRLRLWRSA